MAVTRKAALIRDLRRMFGGDEGLRDRPRSRRIDPGDVLGCETLEGRVVLSGFAGADLVGSLSSVGVVVGGDAEPDFGGFGGRGGFGFWGDHGSASSSTAATQLQTDLTKLQTDYQALAAKSGVTIADLTALGTDSQAIRTAGASVDPTALQKAVSELATALTTSGGDTTQAKTDFNALFTGTSVTQATIDQAFTDLSTTITDSKITSADLVLIAADQTAIQNDLTSLFGASAPDHFGGGSAWVAPA